MNVDQVKGRLKWMRGKALEWAGVITGNRRLKKGGGALETDGKSQAAYGDVKSELKKMGSKDGH